MKSFYETMGAMIFKTKPSPRINKISRRWGLRCEIYAEHDINKFRTTNGSLFTGTLLIFVFLYTRAHERERFENSFDELVHGYSVMGNFRLTQQFEVLYTVLLLVITWARNSNTSNLHVLTNFNTGANFSTGIHSGWNN